MWLAGEILVRGVKNRKLIHTMINYLQYFLDVRGVSFHTVQSRLNAIALVQTYYMLKGFLKGALMKEPLVSNPALT